jgi:hypothetical protein
MADSHILLPVDPVPGGTKIDAEELTVGVVTVKRERDQISGRGALEIADVRNADPGATDYGIIVRTSLARSPITDALTASALAAGASANLDGTAVGVGKSGKLHKVYVGSTAPCKWAILLRDGAVLISVGVLFTGGISSNDPTREWVPPDKSFDTIVYGNGDENFRVVATNLDGSHAADVYTTIYWDEV